MVTISNDSVRLTIDAYGRLQELTNLQDGHNYAGGRSLWRLICKVGDDFEHAIDGDGFAATVSAANDRLTMQCCGDHISVTITAQLCEARVDWSITLDNQHEDIEIRECMFPIIGACAFGDDHAMIWPQIGGMRFSDIRKTVAKHHSLYMAPDEYGVVMQGAYPTWNALNFFMLAHRHHGLYMGSHDESFQDTIHYLRLENQRDLELALVKYPFIRRGQQWSCCHYVTSPYHGSWHSGADIYKTWKDTWWRRIEKPKWVRNMNGWQRLIMKHQYGKELFGYNQLTAMHQDGHGSDIDTILLFGWTKDGHDAGYPDYICDARQGGENTFRENIAKVKAAGGKIILYFNGHLIEKGQAYYEKEGRRISAKDFLGNEYIEQYRFAGKGTIFRQFGHKQFVGACPSCPEWLAKLKSLCDQAIRYGVDGIFFDQMGAYDNVLCCDPNHGHPIPYVTIGQAKIHLLRELRNHIKSADESIAFGTEILCDNTAQHVDFVHSLTGACTLTNPDYRTKGEKPESEFFIDLFRYTCPEVIISDREIRDDTDIPRRVNHALLKGLISDVEIYRCRATLAETPVYAAYLKKANELRQRHKQLLLEGIYQDTQGFDMTSDAIEARTFVQENHLAIVLTQSHMETADTRLTVPGYTFQAFDGLGDYHVQNGKDGIHVSLSQDALAVVILEKQR